MWQMKIRFDSLMVSMRTAFFGVGLGGGHGGFLYYNIQHWQNMI